MQKHLFLEGNIGSGKSRLIREVLLPHLDRVGGFFVQRIFIGDRYVAFKLNPVTKAEEYRLNKYVDSLNGLDNLFLYCGADHKWHVRLEVFNERGIPYLKKCICDNKELVLMDELGGVELGCPAFMDAVFEVINGRIPVLGVLKSPRNRDKLDDKLADKNKKQEYWDSVLARIKRHPRVELLQLSAGNYNEVKARVKAFAEELPRA